MESGEWQTEGLNTMDCKEVGSIEEMNDKYLNSFTSGM